MAGRVSDRDPNALAAGVRQIHVDAAQAALRGARKRASKRDHAALWGLPAEGWGKNTAQNTVWRWDTEHERSFWRHECVAHFWPFFLHAWGTLHGPHARDW